MADKKVKLTADINDKPYTQFVTFWGKIKGEIEKQEDLINYISKVKQSLVNNIDDLKIKLSKLFTINDEYKIEGFSLDEDSEGNSNDFLIVTDKKSIDIPTRESIPTKTSQLINDGNGGEEFFDPFVTRSQIKIDEILIYKDVYDDRNTEYDWQKGFEDENLFIRLMNDFYNDHELYVHLNIQLNLVYYNSELNVIRKNILYSNSLEFYDSYIIIKFNDSYSLCIDSDGHIAENV